MPTPICSPGSSQESVAVHECRDNLLLIADACWPTAGDAIIAPKMALSKLAVFSGWFSSTSGFINFFVQPIMGRLSDTVGRRESPIHTQKHRRPSFLHAFSTRRLHYRHAEALITASGHHAGRVWMAAALVGSIQPAVLFFSQNLLKHTPVRDGRACSVFGAMILYWRPT